MYRSFTFVVAVALAIGGLGGWIVASGRLPIASLAQAETPSGSRNEFVL